MLMLFSDVSKGKKAFSILTLKILLQFAIFCYVAENILKIALK